MTEVYEYALGDGTLDLDGNPVFGEFKEFTPGDVRDLDTYVRFRVTVFGDFDTDDYRLRAFSGIADDATLQEGGFGLSPFGRFPFGDGGVCFEFEEDLFFHGTAQLTGELQIEVFPPTSGNLNLTGDLAVLPLLDETGSLGLAGELVLTQFADLAGELDMSGSLVIGVFQEGNLALDGSLVLTQFTSQVGALALSGDLAIKVFTSLDGSLAMSGTVDVLPGRQSTYFYATTETPLTTGIGSRFYTDRDGSITNIYAWSTDVAINAIKFDVLKNGVSIYTTNAKPTIAGGTQLSPDTLPNTGTFVKGDRFEVQITDLGSLATGTLSLAIVFESITT